MMVTFYYIVLEFQNMNLLYVRVHSYILLYNLSELFICKSYSDPLIVTDVSANS